MKVEYINPFIESVSKVFATMLGCKAIRGEIGISLGDVNVRDFTALVGLSGPVQGTVAMLFSVKTALNIASRMLREEVKIVDDTITDALGEMVNMVAGGAKTNFPREDDTPIDLTLPTVIRGSDYSIRYPSQALWIEVPFDSPVGDLKLRISINEKKS